jgi:hypothetical protein
MHSICIGINNGYGAANVTNTTYYVLLCLVSNAIAEGAIGYELGPNTIVESTVFVIVLGFGQMLIFL